MYIYIYIYIHIWGCDYTFTDYKFKQTLDFQHHNLKFIPLAIHLFKRSNVCLSADIIREIIVLSNTRI